MTSSKNKSASIHHLPTVRSGSIVRHNSHGNNNSNTYYQSPHVSLSSAAQQSLQIFTAISASPNKRIPLLLSGMSEIEIAANLYFSAAKYYHHPQQGLVQIQWTNVNDLVKQNFPKLLDRLERAKILRDDQFHEVFRITEELMRWSGHLISPNHTLDPIATNPSFQPRALKAYLSLPLVFLKGFLMALVLPKSVLKQIDDEDQNK